VSIPALNNSVWKFRDTDVTWETKVGSDGKTYKQRVLSATLERDCDAWSVVQFGTYFSNAAATVSNLTAYCADSYGTTAASVHQMVFSGTWHISNIHVTIDGGRATMTMSIWRHTGVWVEVVGA